MVFYQALQELEKGHPIQCIEFPTIIIKPNQLQEFKLSSFKNLPCMWKTCNILTPEEKKELKQILSLRSTLKFDNIVISDKYIHLLNGTQNQLTIKTNFTYTRLQVNEKYTIEQVRYILNE